VGNFTVRFAPLEAAPLAGSTADASDDATKEPSATQSPLNSRRFSNRIFTHYTIPSTAPIVVGRDGGSAAVALGWRTKDRRLRLLWRRQIFGRGIGPASPRI
jgi:hypothetical protein